MRMRVFASTVLIAIAAAAQEQPPAESSFPQPNAAGANNQAFSDPSALFGGGSGATIGLAVQNIQSEGSYAATVVNADFTLGPVGLGVAVALNLMGLDHHQCWAGRAYLRPFGDMPILRGWAIGVSGAMDRTAPYNVTGPLAQDPQGNPIVPNTRPVYAMGVDTEFELLRNALISLIPYTDFNRIAGAGNGIHVGVLTDLRLPVPLIEMSVQTKFEYRMMQPGYIPEYFDQLYDLGRVQYAVPQGSGTAYVAKYDAAVAARNGHTSFSQRRYYCELALNFGGVLHVGRLYHGRHGDPTRASFRRDPSGPKVESIELY